MATATRKRSRTPEPAAQADEDQGLTEKRALPQDIIDSMEVSNKIHPGLVRRAHDYFEANRIPTGCFTLDFALLGGYPQGYITMSYGYESCSKTTMFLKGVANYHAKHTDRFVGWNDAEGLYDKDWAERLGVDLDRLIVGTPETGEQAIDLVDDWMGRPSMGLIVNDSLPGMVPMGVTETSAEQDFMALHPRLMGKFCSKVSSNNQRERKKGHWITMWNINQWRNKVGFVLGSPLNLPGGRQINHIPTTKIWLKLKKEVMGKDQNDIDIKVCNEQAFKLEKTKHGSSIKEGEFQLYFTPDNELGLKEGDVDNVMAVMPFAKKFGFVRGGGSSWKLHSALPGGAADIKFPSLTKIEEFLYTDREELDTLMRSVIAHQRKAKKHTALPPDGYLVSHLGRLVELS